MTSLPAAIEVTTPWPRDAWRSRGSTEKSWPPASMAGGELAFGGEGSWGGRTDGRTRQWVADEARRITASVSSSLETRPGSVRVWKSNRGAAAAARWSSRSPARKLARGRRDRSLRLPRASSPRSRAETVEYGLYGPYGLP